MIGMIPAGTTIVAMILVTRAETTLVTAVLPVNFPTTLVVVTVVSRLKRFLAPENQLVRDPITAVVMMV